MRVALAVAVGLAAGGLASARADIGTPPPMTEIGVEERLGETLPADLEFVDTEGERVALDDFFDRDTPVLLVLAYSGCPMLCSLVLQGASEALANLDLELGADYRAITISVDPDESPREARQTQDLVLRRVGKPGERGAWPFLVGDEADIAALAQALGFGYGYDERSGEYAHPAVIFVLSPARTVSRYLYGFDYAPGDVRLALVEASEGKTGSFFDRVVLSCYRYDPASRRYGLYVQGLLRLGGAATAALLGAAIVLLWRRERGRA